VWPRATACIGLLFSFASVVCGGAEKPGPFTFVYGLDNGGTSADLKAFGVNTLYIDLRPNELANPEPVRQQVREAAAAGYKVIIGIPTTTFPTHRISPYSGPYLDAVSAMIGSIVNGLKTEPGVSAWATGHYLEKYISYYDEDFRKFLLERYASLDGVNQYWDTSLLTLDAIRQETALDLHPQLPFGFGRAAVDVADYRQYVFWAVMRQWAEQIKSLDDTRPLLTGAITLYRSIAAVPVTYDIVAVSFPPDIMRPNSSHYGDSITHNVHAVDMARRGGRFDVIPVLRMPLPGEPGWDTGGLRGWVLEADMHGACGVALENWDRYRQSPQIAHRTLRLLAETWPQADFSGRPRPTSAILYSPYAEGFQVAGQPVYGHLKGFASGQPSNLVEDLRMGTCFGPVDYLTSTDLATADLRRYGVIIAPAALGITQEQSSTLAEYVRSGGALLGDIGLGLHHTGSWLRLPPTLANALGVRELLEGESRAGDLSVIGQVPWLPHVTHGMKSSGTFRSVAAATGKQTYKTPPYSVSSYAAYAGLTESAVAVGSLRTKGAEQGNPVFAGLMCNTYGRGVAVFTTHLLYAYWPLSDPLSGALHYDLMARRATCELVSSPFLPDTVEVSLEDDRIRLLNGARGQVSPVVALYGRGDRLVQAALNVVTAQYTAGAERQTVYAAVPGETILSLPITTITAQPYGGEASVVIRELRPERIRLSVAGPGAHLNPRRGDLYELSRPDRSVRVRFAVNQGGVYQIHDGSRHTVTIQPERGTTRSLDVVARNGALTFTEEIYREGVTIRPAP